jgi:hypothetical protein
VAASECNPRSDDERGSRDPAVHRPILVTGIPRSGTTWVGRMLCAGNQAGYINEPFNLSVSPGSIRLPVEHWYPYITEQDEQRILAPLGATFAFRYPLLRELARCRTRNDVHHTVKTWYGFVRSRGRRPLVKEPHAVFSADWFARRLDSDVVVTVRHPLAVISSWKRLGWDFDFGHLLGQPALMRDWLEPFAPEMEAARSAARDIVDRVALFWRVVYSVVAEERYPRAQIVRQEVLSRDPVTEYEQLYRALNLTFTSQAARAVASSSSSKNAKETTLENPHETQLDSGANLENWRRRLTRDEVLRIRRITEETVALYYPDQAWE